MQICKIYIVRVRLIFDDFPVARVSISATLSSFLAIVSFEGFTKDDHCFGEVFLV